VPRRRPVQCRICGGHESKVGPVSYRGKCRNCALSREKANYHALKDHRGEPFEPWRVRTAASVGAIPLDLLDTYLATREHRS